MLTQSIGKNSDSQFSETLEKFRDEQNRSVQNSSKGFAETVDHDLQHTLKTDRTDN